MQTGAAPTCIGEFTYSIAFTRTAHSPARPPARPGIFDPLAMTKTKTKNRTPPNQQPQPIRLDELGRVMINDARNLGESHDWWAPRLSGYAHKVPYPPRRTRAFLIYSNSIGAYLP